RRHATCSWREKERRIAETRSIVRSIDMNTRIKWLALAVVVMTLTALASFGVSAQQNQMSFFVTSAGSGNGANLGGVAGADKICQNLAAAAGAGNRMWRAY